MNAPLTPGEKHTPLISINGNKVKIIVPNHPPQSEAHYISNITLFQNGEILIEKNIGFDEDAVLETELENTENLTATEFCNLHGKWDSEGKILGEQ